MGPKPFRERLGGETGAVATIRRAGHATGVAESGQPTSRPWWQLPAPRGAWVRPFKDLSWREAPAAAAAYLGSAPGTITYVFTVLITTVSLQGAGHQLTEVLMRRESTNVHNMLHNPVRVLLASAFWLDTSHFPLALLVLFVVVMAPTERRIGTMRWIAVGAAGHIGATLCTTVGINFGVDHNLLRPELTRTVDVGISYFAMAVAAVYAALLPGWWRWAARSVIAIYVVANLVASNSFTDYGHLFAAIIGFALAPLVTRGASWRELHRQRSPHFDGT